MTITDILIFFAACALAAAWAFSRAKLDDCTCRLCLVRREEEGR